ncbi:MAG: glycosyltransferase family 4 protein [Epsilonproteobacteria bacterium]|nr:glycosyltransferase family 4 protein [Campylobacterota bacterium]
MKKKISIIVTVPLSLETWFKGQPRYLSNFYDIELITSESQSVEQICTYENVSVTLVDFTRQINPIKDLKVLMTLWSHFRRTKPDMVYSITPKAGLLGMISAWLARVPVRLHLIVGLAYFGSVGKRRFLLKSIERITYFFSTNLYANSLNLPNIIAKELTSKKINVIGYGSVNGVDTEFFKDTMTSKEKSAFRNRFSINDEDFLLLFTGRIVGDKGVNELVKAFDVLSKKHSRIHLLMVGDYEHHLDPIKPETYDLIQNNSRIHTVSFQSDVRPYFCIADLLILPSYREGLPNVLIEGGSCGLPLIATDINGCNEVIIEGENGLLIPLKSANALENAIETVLTNAILYNKLKTNARTSILRRYDQTLYWEKLHNELDLLLNASKNSNV